MIVLIAHLIVLSDSSSRLHLRHSEWCESSFCTKLSVMFYFHHAFCFLLLPRTKCLKCTLWKDSKKGMLQCCCRRSALHLFVAFVTFAFFILYAISPLALSTLKLALVCVRSLRCMTICPWFGSSFSASDFTVAMTYARLSGIFAEWFFSPSNTHTH